MRDAIHIGPDSGTAQTGSSPQGRHERMFDILCHTERAQRTAARCPGALDDETGEVLRQRALASLKVQSGASVQGRLRALLTRLQKNAAASSPTVIAPMTSPLAGSVTAKET